MSMWTALLVVELLVAKAVATYDSGFLDRNPLCNGTLLEANATGEASFQPGVLENVYATAQAAEVSVSTTITANDTTLIWTTWYNAHGANYSDDLYLGYDVCHLSLNNLTMNALYNSHSDTGNCLQTMDADCINAMQAVVTSRANILTTPSSYGPDSNLTNSALPMICDDIAATLEGNMPSVCAKYFNTSVVATGYALTGDSSNPNNSQNYPGIQEDTNCRWNGSYSILQAALFNTEIDDKPIDSLYDGISTIGLYPYIFVFMNVANYNRSFNVQASAYSTCLHITTYNNDSRVPPSPTPPAPTSTPSTLAKAPHKSHGMSGGAIAGTVIGVLAGVGLIAGLAFILWKRKRTESKSPLPYEMESKQKEYGDVSSNVDDSPSEAPDTAVAEERFLPELSPSAGVRPELQGTAVGETRRPPSELP